MLSDDHIKLLAIVGLLLYAVAAGVTLTGRLGHWPLTITLVAITLGAVVVMYLDGTNWHGGDAIILAVCLASLGIAVWQVAAATKWSMVAVIVVVSLHSLFLLTILLFLYFFRLDRLW